MGEHHDRDDVTLFLCGDVMTGRGIDQVLAHPVEPTLYEPFVLSALDYLDLAERANGRIPQPVDFAYVWGDVLAELDERAPDWRIVNLETSVTTSDRPEPKGINYRMNPANAECLTTAKLDCCVLANNHVLDWGRVGLLETLGTLQGKGIAIAGAGRDADEAGAPAVLGSAGAGAGRVLVFGFATPDSGVPASWRATANRSGVSYLPDLTPAAAAAESAVRRIGALRQPGDVVVVSIHWGGNWGYPVPAEHRAFAHTLIESGTVDIVHGHSSHHPKGIERYRDRLILYGCGDFINDYEGIAGYEEFHPDLALAYLATVESGSGRLTRLEMVPFRRRRFRLERASTDDANLLERTLDRQSEALGAGVELGEDRVLRLTER